VVGLQPSLTLQSQVGIRVDVLLFANQRSLPAVSQTVVVLPPNSPPRVVLVVTGPQRIDVCDSITMSAAMSTGNAGRSFIYSWFMDASFLKSLMRSMSDCTTLVAYPRSRYRLIYLLKREHSLYRYLLLTGRLQLILTRFLTFGLELFRRLS
jgi:hypothetical protein